MQTIHYNSKLARLLTCLTDTDTIMFFGFILTEAENLDIRTLAHERTTRPSAMNGKPTAWPMLTSVSTSGRGRNRRLLKCI